MRGEATEEQRAPPTRLMRFARPAMNDNAKPYVQQFDEGFGDIDPTASGRAAEASAAVHAQYAGLIDAIMEDRSLSPEERAVAIYGLRQRQNVEASGASEAVMAAAFSAARGRREMMRLAGHRPAQQQGAAEFSDNAPSDSPAGSKPGGGTSPGELRQSFRNAAKAVMRRAPTLPPKPRRRRSGETQGAFGRAAKPVMRRAVRLAPEANGAAIAFLSDTLDWLNLWQDNADYGSESVTFDLEQNYLSPHL